MANILYWAAAVMLFGLVILVHELGHFWAAKLTGVHVVEFSVGLGPSILRRRSKTGTAFTLRVLPLGGYCRFLGDDDALEHQKAYFEEKVWKRVFVSLGGPVMNYIGAFLILILLFMATGVTTVDHTVGGVMPDSPAHMAGLMPGDRLIRISDRLITSPQDATEQISAVGDTEIPFVIQRGHEEISLSIKPYWDEAEGRSMIGIHFGTYQARFGVADSARATWNSIRLMSRLIVDMIRDSVFKGEGTQNLVGPIGTVIEVRRETQEGGLSSYLFIAALISVNLGLFNMLPIPGLDGCKLIFLALEKVRGKRLDPGREGLVVLAGFALLILVMVIVMYQDIARLFG
ncbi:MAG: M50 family metallopeptidase [Clostridia bacterium]|nr:M50 family metallopeptidase [Clostridia bacterium]